MSEIRFTPANIATFAEKGKLITGSNESDIIRYKQDGKSLAIKEYKPHLSLAQINLYEEATDLSAPIASAFTTETPRGIITYEIDPIDIVVQSLSGRIYTVSQFMDDGRDLREWVGDTFEGLQRLSTLIMEETGFKGIQIVPYNTKRYKSKNGIRCVITDICETIAKLRR